MGLLFLIALILLSVLACIALSWLAIQHQRCAWLGVTYLFWMCFSLLNPMFLAGLSIPILLPFFASIYSRYCAFLLPPLLLAIPFATFASICFIRYLAPAQQQLQKVALAVDGFATSEDYPITHDASPALKALIYNFMFLFVFVALIEIDRAWQMRQELKHYQVDCFTSQPFLISVIQAGRNGSGHQSSHAYFMSKGVGYSWSYVEQRFVERSESIYKNWHECNIY